jgi:hypothetical protein
LDQLAIAVKDGHLTEEQKLELELACFSNDYNDWNAGDVESPTMSSLEIALLNLP